MAFNPSPQVGAARDFAKRFGKSHVVILAISGDGTTLEYASYGRTARECAEAKEMADVGYEAVLRALWGERGR